MEQVVETLRLIQQGKRRLLWLSIFSTTLVAMPVIAGLYVSPLFFLSALIAIPFIVVSMNVYNRLRRLRILLKLRERWGSKVKKDRDLEAIKLLHHYLHTETGAINSVDDQTWHDLNLDMFYSYIDRTYTAEGQATLYHILKTPSLSLGPLKERAAMIRSFQENRVFREQLQRTLLSLEGRSDKDTTELVWGQLPPPTPYTLLYNVLALAALLSLFTPLLIGAQSLLVIMALFGLNTFVHHRVSRDIAHMLSSVSSLAKLLRAAGKIALIENHALGGKRERLEAATKACRGIMKKTRTLHPKAIISDMDILYEYFKYFFLLEVRAFYAAHSEINRQIVHLREIYLIIGELDALQAVASYRESLPYSEPDLFTDHVYCRVEDVYHPLLSGAVPNSIALDKQGLLVTGSNMSGKSTFLRTMGLCALLAQTIFTCPAVSYHGSLFRIVTSISLEDSLAEGKSFYYQEAERLLKLIQTAALDGEAPAFCIVDELLSGTNYIERLAASEAILDYLAKQKALVIIATHDLDLAEKLRERYRCCHFTDRVSHDGLHFDFKLKEGVATTRNAIKMLAYLGYPQEIVVQASLESNRIGV